MSPPSVAPALTAILKQDHLVVFFQPILDFVRQCVFAYECLVRGPAHTPWHKPDALFSSAHALNKSDELELLCLRSALYHVQRMNLTHTIFVNFDWAHFATLPLTQTLTLLQHYHLPPSQLVFELRNSHHAELQQLVDAVADNVRCYRTAGIGIALDHTGDNNLLLWTALQVDYIKTDAYFCHNLAHSPRQREFLRMLRALAGRISTRIIAQGIEDSATFHELYALGFELGQGYYFAKPQASPLKHIPARLFQSSTPAPVTRSDTIACLILTRQAVPPELHIDAVGALFHSQPDVYTFPVVNHNQVPLGIVRRHDILHLLMSRYGHELHGRKPISMHMDNNPLIFDSALPLEDASQQVTMHAHITTPEHDFIITRQGCYVGMGRVIDLLRRITELQIRNARYANPLTLLPGNVPIQEHLEMLLQDKIDFVVAYCDLDNFKPFNDVYGYDKGDDVIKFLGGILLKYAEPPDFVGHVGGDDFIVVFRCADWKQRCDSIIADFDAQAPHFYSVEDRDKGGIYTYDRSGNAKFFAVLSVSIGVVHVDPHRCQSHHDIATLATEAKHQAKQSQGSHIFIERRRGPLGLI
jgi:diguanylate cyclase (GGDEF)-like protein